MTNSPYSAFAALLAPLSPVSPAELQGLLIGRTCAGAGFDAAAWLTAARELLDAEPDERIAQALMGLQEMLKGELASGEVALVLLLPSDDEALGLRTRALGQWCQGFLAGYGLAAGKRKLDEEAREILQDLVAIAQIQDTDDESEASEADYMELTEYLRVAPLLLLDREQLPEPAAKPSLH